MCKSFAVAGRVEPGDDDVQLVRRVMNYLWINGIWK